MRNDYNEQVQKENNAKADAARKANREARRHAPATPAPAAPAIAENITAAPAVPAPAPAPQPPVPAAPRLSAEPGKITWSHQPGAKGRQCSNRNMLDAYGPEKAVDGNTSSELSDVSISATGVAEGKTAWFGIDFGKETNRTIEKVVIYTPANLTLLGTMEEFKVILYDNNKNVLAEKTFNTTPSEKSTNVTTWKLDAPVKARALRVESTDPAHPLALTEVEAYGPEEAAETPDPAPAEE
ncbi:discoidin domain-containing protein, partial [Akkermansia massiliensis]